MDLPLIGTVDLTPSGLFLVFAVLVVVGYLTWQIRGSRRVAAGAKNSEDAVVEGAHVEGVPVETPQGDDESHVR